MVSSYLTDLHGQVRNARVLSSLLDCEVEGLEDRLSEGLAYLEEDQFVSAHQVLSGSLVEVQKAMEAKVNEVIGEAEEAINHAADLSAEVDEARGHIAKAREALEARGYENAVQFAQQARESMDSLEDTAKQFVEATGEARTIITTAKKFGINVEAAEDSLDQAMALHESNPVAALENAHRSLEQVQEALDAFTPTLEWHLKAPRAAAGKDVEATLTIQNTSKALAKDLEVEVLGELEVKGLEVPPSVRANDEVALTFTLVFASSGEVPVMVKGKARRLIDEQEYDWEQVFQVKVKSA
jgi:tetratricopeptide (TPR) repeat protein